MAFIVVLGITLGVGTLAIWVGKLAAELITAKDRRRERRELAEFERQLEARGAANRPPHRVTD